MSQPLRRSPRWLIASVLLVFALALAGSAQAPAGTSVLPPGTLGPTDMQRATARKVGRILEAAHYRDRKSTRLNPSHSQISYAVFCLKKKNAECILMQMYFYRRCGVKDLALRVNSLCDAESKARYRDALVAFLTPDKDHLSEDSQRRL